MGDLVKLITPLPSPATPYPEPTIDPGLVILYKDSKWDNQNEYIYLNNYYATKRFAIESPLAKQATWIAFNLPVGTAMTLIEHKNLGPDANYDLSEAGKSIDLVGTGQLATVDLKAVGINDCLQAFVWRFVDLNAGVVEVYEKDNLTGNRVIIFLAEWPLGKVQNISQWYMNDKISSMRWWTILEQQKVTFYEKSDGSGKNFTITKEKPQEYLNLNDVDKMNDKISAFDWVKN